MWVGLEGPSRYHSMIETSGTWYDTIGMADCSMEGLRDLGVNLKRFIDKEGGLVKERG